MDVALAVDKERRQRVVEFDVCYCGPLAGAERVVAPLRKLGKPLRDQLGPAPYPKLQGSDKPGGPSSFGAYVKGGLVYGLTPALIDAAIDYIEAHPVNNFEIEFGANGGAVSRVAPTATAYWDRRASYEVLAFAFWKVPGDGAAASTAWVHGAWKQLEPHTRGHYVNIDQRRRSREPRALGVRRQLRAARELKKRYDPNNLFHLNANIKPA